MDERPAIGAVGVDQAPPASGGPTEDPVPQELINGRYSILSRIAEGPTGKLYRSRNVKTESEVTLKVLMSWPGLDDALIRQLREELSVTRALTGRQSNIALVHDCDLTADGRVLVVMEPIRGRTLLELIERREPLPIERALRLAFQIAEGLHAAHDLGLVHGALKPEHVLVEGMDTVKVVGFEVARLQAAAPGALPLDSPAASGDANGPSPLARARVLTEAADTQAVGRMLLEMLTSGARSGPQSIGTLPVAVKQLVMQALVRVPGAPPQDMAALTKALSAELGRRPLPSASRARRRARPRSRRAQWSFIGAGALGIGLSALVVWLTWSLVGTPRRPGTSEILAVPGQEAVSDPSSSGAGAAMPARSADSAVGLPRSLPPATHAGPLTPDRPVATAAPSPGDTVLPGAFRVRPPRSRQPVPDTPSPVELEGVPARQPRVAGSAADSGAGRPEHDEPDPAVVIDWLIKEKGGLLQRR